MKTVRNVCVQLLETRYFAQNCTEKPSKSNYRYKERQEN